MTAATRLLDDPDLPDGELLQAGEPAPSVPNADQRRTRSASTNRFGGISAGVVAPGGLPIDADCTLSVGGEHAASTQTAAQLAVVRDVGLGAVPLEDLERPLTHERTRPAQAIRLGPEELTGRSVGGTITARRYRCTAVTMVAGGPPRLRYDGMAVVLWSGSHAA